MLTTADLIRVPYTPDLSQAGISHVCRSLPYRGITPDVEEAGGLRGIVVGKAAELAFRRTLAARNIPFENLGATPFTAPNNFTVALGGRRCELKSCLIKKKNASGGVHNDLDGLLNFLALVPGSQMASNVLNEHDLYLFAFILEQDSSSPQESEPMLANSQLAYWIHSLPAGWAQPLLWASLGKLVLKCDVEPAVLLELGGKDEQGEFQREEMELLAGTRVIARTDFYSLAYLHLHQTPQGRLGVHSSRLKQTNILRPADWTNIWVKGMEIILTGYMTRLEFRQRAHRLPPRSLLDQGCWTRVENFALRVAELHPLAGLFEHTREFKKDSL